MKDQGNKKILAIIATVVFLIIGIILFIIWDMNNTKLRILTTFVFCLVGISLSRVRK